MQKGRKYFANYLFVKKNHEGFITSFQVEENISIKVEKDYKIKKIIVLSDMVLCSVKDCFLMPSTTLGEVSNSLEAYSLKFKTLKSLSNLSLIQGKTL